jgi:hypothetical protein
MDRKSKILIWSFVVLILASAAFTYWRIVVKKNYIISAWADCDPTVDKCFVWQCDPNATDESEKCTGDPEKDTWYYQVIERKAFNIPLCDPNDENCEALTCPEGEKDCLITFCSSETAKDGEECSDPETYIKEHPEALEEEACDPETDENCTVDEECDLETDENCIQQEDCDPETEDCPADDESAPADSGAGAESSVE